MLLYYCKWNFHCCQQGDSQWSWTLAGDSGTCPVCFRRRFSELSLQLWWASVARFSWAWLDLLTYRISSFLFWIFVGDHMHTSGRGTYRPPCICGFQLWKCPSLWRPCRRAHAHPQSRCEHFWLWLVLPGACWCELAWAGLPGMPECPVSFWSNNWEWQRLSLRILLDHPWRTVCGDSEHSQYSEDGTDCIFMILNYKYPAICAIGVGTTDDALGKCCLTAGSKEGEHYSWHVRNIFVASSSL